MCAYFIATKSETSNSKAVAQVLRQLVSFLIASKGYLDYVIWFAVNSIERFVVVQRSMGTPSADDRTQDSGLSTHIHITTRVSRRPAHGRNRANDESADLDVDLSPQVNTALRSEILYYTTSGIKESVRAVSDELITIPISGESEKVRCQLGSCVSIRQYGR